MIRDASSGALVRQGQAPHPPGTEVDPGRWLEALRVALAQAGGLDDVAALSVAGQQHGMVCLDEAGQVVRPALAVERHQVRGCRSRAGSRAWRRRCRRPARRSGRDAVGSVPVAAFTVTKLRWLAEHEPGAMARAAAVCLPHDWLTWQLAAAAPAVRAARPGSTGCAPIGVTPAGPDTGRRPPASTGSTCCTAAAGRDLAVPRVLGPAEGVRRRAPGSRRAVLGPGTGDNAAAALGLAAQAGDVVVSIGTSGTVFAVSDAPTADPGGVDRRLRRRDRAGSCRWSARSTRRACSSPSPRCWTSISTGSTNSRWPPLRARAG